MEWFRMYSDMPNDPKIGTLNDTQFRTWVELLCLAGKEGNGGSIGVSLSEAAWSLRRDIKPDICVLESRGLVMVDGDSITITKWEKRQYKSDHDAADRMRRHRQNKRDVTVTSQNRDREIPEQNRADTEQNREDTEPPRVREGKAVVDFNFVRELYRDCYRDLLPSVTVCQRLQWIADNFDEETITDAFAAASSCKAKTIDYVLKRLKNIKHRADTLEETERWLRGEE